MSDMMYCNIILWRGAICLVDKGDLFASITNMTFILIYNNVYN